MLNNLMEQITEHQYVDGEVDRPEFDPANDRNGWPDEVNPEDRLAIERYVYGKIPDRHRFKTADGEKGIVYFDSRGRATSCVITEMDGEELARLARTYGKKLKGDNGNENGNGKFKPSKDPGYKVPDLAESDERTGKMELTEATAVELDKIPKDRQTYAKKVASALKGKITDVFDGIHGYVVIIEVDHGMVQGIRLRPPELKALAGKLTRWVEFHGGDISVGM